MPFDAKTWMGVLLSLGVVVAASSCSSPATSSLPRSHLSVTPSPAAELAANQATRAYRASMTQAGQQLVAAIDQLAQDDASNPAALSEDVARLDKVYDLVRPQFAATLSGSTSGPGTPGDMLGGIDVSQSLLGQSATARSSAISTLSGLAGDVQLVLGRVVLAPSGIALACRQDAEWIALRSPTSASSSSNASPSWSDIQVTAAALDGRVQTLDGIGSIVAPRMMSTTFEDLASLQRDVASWNGGSARNVVQAADGVANDLGELASALHGYGSSGAYQ
jgi:hypothetical protein